MALPEEVKRKTVALMQRYCDERVPAEAQSKVRASFGIRGNSVSLYEERPPWDGEGEWSKMVIAQFRYGEDGRWTLYWPDRNGRWHEYDDVNPTKDIRKLLDEVDDDPMDIFWL